MAAKPKFKLQTCAEVIDVLGGTQAVADMLGRGYTAVHNWRQWNEFPATTYLVLTKQLERLGHMAPIELWKMDKCKVG